MTKKLTLKSDLLAGKEVTVLYSSENYYIGMVEDASPFLIMDDVANYFIFNAETGKIEGLSNNLDAATKYVTFLEDEDDAEIGISEAPTTPSTPTLN